jgi:hypothetical protein
MIVAKPSWFERAWGKYPVICWLSIVGLVLIVFYALSWDLETRVRWSGITFECLGIAVVAIGLSGSNDLLGGRSFARWAMALFRKEPPRHAFVEGQMIVSATSFGRARVSVTGLSADEKIARLEQRCDQLQDAIDAIEDEHRKTKGEIKLAVDEERTARTGADAAISDRLNELMVGSLNLEVGGLGFLVLGVFLANASQDWAPMLAQLGLK